MRKTENECVSCPTDYGCLGNSCKYRFVTRYYCDRCKEERTLYYYDGEELCEDCLLEEFEVVEGSDYW